MEKLRFCKRMPENGIDGEESRDWRQRKTRLVRSLRTHWPNVLPSYLSQSTPLFCPGNCESVVTLS